MKKEACCTGIGIDVKTIYPGRNYGPDAGKRLRVFIDEEPYAAKDLMKESAASADQGERVEVGKEARLST